MDTTLVAVKTESWLSMFKFALFVIDKLSSNFWLCLLLHLLSLMARNDSTPAITLTHAMLVSMTISAIFTLKFPYR